MNRTPVDRTRVGSGYEALPGMGMHSESVRMHVIGVRART